MSQPSWTPPAAPASKIQPALIGGAILGLLSGLLSAVPIANYCCCLWAILGGLLASFLYIKKSPIPVRAGEGAMLGGLAGVIGGLIYLVIAVPLIYFVAGGDAIEAQLRRSGVDIPASGFLLIMIGGIIGALFIVVLSVVGGLLGVPIFEKRKNGAGAATAPPPPPPSFGTGT